MGQALRSLVSGADHVALLHPDDVGKLVVWTPRRERSWHSISPAAAASLLEGLDGELDVFATPNVFHGWRVVRHLRALRAVPGH